MTQVVEYLPSKCNAVNSNPSTDPLNPTFSETTSIIYNSQRVETTQMSIF
jgi:hypothetical protein